MSRWAWLARRRRQLLAAAAAGDLFYTGATTLRHRASVGDLVATVATVADTALVADLITTGALRRDESGALCLADQPTTQECSL